METLLFHYGVIAIAFIIALIYLIRKFMPSKQQGAGCNKGCGCSSMPKAEGS